MIISSIYSSFETRIPEKVKARIEAIVTAAVARNNTLTLFFRADDIGPPSGNFSRMMELFIAYQIPLCLAVVPAWMTRPRWKAMEAYQNRGGDLFCWHVHGYQHKNHEVSGKKHEFGPARTPEALFSDLSNGLKRLQTIMGMDLTPVFTPPWNRCTLETMVQLKQLGFKGVSRSIGSRPPAPDGLLDFPVHVDLHTRRETDSSAGWQNLCKELEIFLDVAPCGIMLHHMRMNHAAFLFLDYLLALFADHDQIKMITYKEMV